MAKVKLYPGVYRIINKDDGKCYVGSTSYLEKRKSQHFQSLKAGNHRNPYLQAAWNKYGSESFEFEVLERCEKEQLIEREQHWLDTLQPDYNIRKQAEHNAGITRTDVKGNAHKYRDGRAKADADGKAHGGARSDPSKRRSRHHVRTDEERQAMHDRRVQASTGRKMSPEAREKIRQSHLGRKASPETLEKLRQSHLGQMPTPEAREKNRQAQLGRTLSPEAREKIRQSKLGKPCLPETREKIRQAHLGKKRNKAS